MNKLKTLVLVAAMVATPLMSARSASADEFVSAAAFAKKAVAQVAKQEGLSESSYSSDCMVGTSEVVGEFYIEAVGISDCTVKNKNDLDGKSRGRFIVVFRSIHSDVSWEYQESPVAVEDLRRGKKMIAALGMSFRGIKDPMNAAWTSSGTYKRDDGHKSSYSGKGRRYAAMVTGVGHSISGGMDEYLEIYHNEGASRGEVPGKG